MGTIDRRMKCGTCGHGLQKCFGHYGSTKKQQNNSQTTTKHSNIKTIGRIDLAYPVYHVGLMDVIVRALKCVCFFCSSSLLNDVEKATAALITESRSRFSFNQNNIKNKKTCPKCSGGCPNYSKSALTIKCDWSKEREREREIDIYIYIYIYRERER